MEVLFCKNCDDFVIHDHQVCQRCGKVRRASTPQLGEIGYEDLGSEVAITEEDEAPVRREAAQEEGKTA